MKQNNIKILNNKHIAILSTCIDDWGGSEELWAKSSTYLQKEGFSITVLKENINYNHKRIAELKNKHVDFIALNNSYSEVLKRTINAYYQLIKPYFSIQLHAFEKFLKKRKPALVFISQAINFDGLHYAQLCLKQNIPYIIVSHKAVEFFWPPKDERDYMINVYKHAKKCFFVSEHNQNLTEEQFGFRFNNAEIVRNPLKIKPEPLQYPSTKEGFKLVMIGRLFVIDKGHDIILRVLAKEKWKKRKLSLSIVGTGPDYDGLKAMSSLLKCENIEFLGHQDNIKKIWLNHHALAIPSRSEGMPLVVIEAMAAGRTVIATRAGGTMELIEEGATGYIGDATENSFDQTLENAWSNRAQWQNMGLKASKHIKEQIPINPELDFAKEIISLINE